MFKSTIYGLGLLLCSFICIKAKSQPVANKPTSQTQVDSANPLLAFIYPSATRVNYVKTREAMGPIQDYFTFNNASYTEVKESNQYMDGLGLPVQSVAKQLSPNVKDIVTHVLFDTFNRQAYQYLPYAASTVGGLFPNGGDDGKFKLNVFTDQRDFYQNSTKNPGCKGEHYFYSKTVFEPSPLNRPIKTMPAGNKWVGASRGIQYKYMINTAADSVRLWHISLDTLTYLDNDTSTNIPVTSAQYDTGQLYKTVVVDENGNATVEYKDLDELLILKKVQIGNIPADYSGYSGFLCTYYIYDDYNHLRFVIQPKAVATLAANGWQLNGTIVNELCFRYEYDERDRMIAKKVPGAGWEYMVYDIRDRLVFNQDGNMRTGNQWHGALYDDLNRVVTTGLITYTGNRSSLQVYETGLPTGGSSNSRILFSTSGLKTDYFVNLPVKTPTTIKAKRSVTINPGFVTTPGNPVLVTIGNQPEKADSSTVANNPLPVPADSLTVLTQTYYDDYSWSPNVTYNEGYVNKLDSGNNLHAEAVPTLAEQQKGFNKGLVTITRVRVIEDPANIPQGDFLTSTNFYDDRGRLLQVQSDNYKTGKDTITNRYDFTGKILCNYVAHNNPAAGTKGVVKVKTNMDYDHAGRLLKVWKTVNDTPDGKQLIVTNSYDELGRLNKKELGTIDSAAIETLDYEYNIRGWLKSINRDYTNDGFTHRWFGEELAYDWGFDSVQYNGNIAGVKWRSKGTGTRQAYGYTYDKTDRLMGADYSVAAGSSWYDNATVNFDMQMGNGRDAATAYDENGNILAMKQWGLKINNSSVIDNLSYNYSGNSNKLLNVIDTANDPQTKLGDFRTSGHHPNYGNKTTSTIDYTYDANGNLLKDLNKDIGTASVSGIQYNHLNLPYKVTVYDSLGIKGTITYIYDAAGNKLEKRVTESGHTDVKTDYIGAFVYENNQLQFFAHEEGRTRYAKKYFVNGDSAYQFIQDYFVKDHLGNVRMVLTEQKDTAKYIATMEPAYRQKEDALFNNVTLTAYPDSLVPGGYPVDTTLTNPNNYVSKVNGSGNKIGPSLTLKVMSGDTVDIGVKSFYRPNGSAGGNSNSLADILVSLAGGIVAASGEVHGTFSQLSNTGNSPLLAPLTSFMNSRDTSSSTKPRAYLNWILLDEQFNYVNSYPQSGAIPVGNADELTTLAQGNIPITKNGYLYIYVSNETQNWDVFFDNVVVNHRTGPLLEESHYYPFGLTMAGISDKALKPDYTENKYKFNDGTELNTKLDINLYETDYRLYDPQIGRFVQMDPNADDYAQWSPYNFAIDNPVAVNDPLGSDTLTRKTNLDPVYVVAKAPKKLDTENGQVLPPLPWYGRIFGSERSWHGYYVDGGGYVHGYSMHVLMIHDFGSKAEIGAVEEAVEATAKAATKGITKYVVYKAYKAVRGRLILYIGKAKNALMNRYSAQEIRILSAEVIEKLNNLPDNATALGVEQAILDLNGGKGVLSNVNNAAVKKIYLEAGLDWLEKNIPNWKEEFKFDLYK